MKVLTQETWNKLEFPDWRVRFFIECYSESLSVETPHFHQAKMMGIIDLAREVLNNIKVFETNDKGKGYLISSLKELKLALERDLVAKDIFHDLLDVFDDCSKNFNSEKFPKSLIIQLGIICKRITEEDDVYFSKLQDSLLKSITGICDTSKKETITNDIYSSTRRYVTYLLNSGYSPTYLYNKTQLLTRKSNYSGRNFKDQLKYFFGSLDCKLRDFNVFFGVKTNKKKTLKEYKSNKNVQLLTTIPEKHYTISTKTFSKFSPDFYLRVVVSSLDYVSAALLASEQIESEVDLLKTFTNRINLTVHSSCYVDYKVRGHTYQRDVNAALLNVLLTYDHRSGQLNKYLTVDFRKKLEPLSVRKLEGILKNLRQVKESARLEQKLLNLWISLESLNYLGDDKSIISGITSFLPKIYAIESIKQRVDYVKKLLIAYKVDIPTDVKTRHDIGSEVSFKDIDLSKFHDVVKNEVSARSICNEIKDLEFLYYRFYGLYKIISDKKEVKKRIVNTREDIENQLYRIYKIRNNIVHVGFSDNLNYYAINHLADYVNTLILLVFDTLVSSRHLSVVTIDDILLSTQLVVESKFKSIEKDSIIDFNDLNFKVII